MDKFCASKIKFPTFFVLDLHRKELAAMLEEHQLTKNAERVGEVGELEIWTAVVHAICINRQKHIIFKYT